MMMYRYTNGNGTTVSSITIYRLRDWWVEVTEYGDGFVSCYRDRELLASGGGSCIPLEPLII